MTIPAEVVASVLGLLLASLLAALGFFYNAILKINERLARIEEHLGIETAVTIKKKKHHEHHTNVSIE